MPLTVCPVALVAAPVEVVWANLVDWHQFSKWADVQVHQSSPEGPATPGQTISFGSLSPSKTFGGILRFTFKVQSVDSEKHRLSLHAFFPLGMQQKANIVCSAVDMTTCRVQYG